MTEAQATESTAAKRPPVVVTIGERSARLRLTRMGGPVCIGLSKDSRAMLGVDIGDEVDVTLELDTAERAVIPPLLADDLAADRQAMMAFKSLSYTWRKEMAASIAEAKRDPPRLRRLEKMLGLLR